jgi:hypothetical protein
MPPSCSRSLPRPKDQPETARFLKRGTEDTVNDFTTAFSVDQTPAEVFEAITDVRGWWSGQIDGNTGQPGDEFTYHYEDLHRCRIRVIQAEPGQKVAWLVLDGGPVFTQNKQEWRGTTISFDIARIGGQTEVHFTHRGLIPQIECFGACSSAWGSYINGSLRSLITTGNGYPSPASSDSSPTGR